MKLKYKFMLVVVTILLLSSLTIGSSYSLWLSNSTQVGENVINVDCFNITFEDSDSINLENAMPIHFSVGRNISPYTFTISNVCETIAAFEINLEELASTTLDDSNIRFMLNNGGSTILSNLDSASPILSGDGATLSDASTNNSRTITKGVLWPNKSRTYSIRLWLDENATLESMNKRLDAKVVAVSTPYKENPCTYDGTLTSGAEYSDGTYTYHYREKGTSDGWSNAFEDGWGVKLSDINSTEATTPLCTSINNKPIVATSYMYYNATKLANIDVSSFDMSNVTTMQDMFASTGSNVNSFTITGLDKFDTYNVSNMEAVFANCASNANSFSIDNLSNWVTSSVTKTRNMFTDFGLMSSTWIVEGLSRWDTSRVEDMTGMFNTIAFSAPSLNLDLSEWNTKSVTTMTQTFEQAGTMSTTWSVGDLSYWDTSNVKDMSSMFANAGNDASSWSIGNISNWNVSKVTTFHRMFQSTGSSSSIFDLGDLSSWDTRNATKMSQMFQSAGYSAQNWNIGTLNVYATNIYRMFYGNKSANGTLNIYSNPSSGSSGYNQAFTNAATSANAKITVNYASTTTNIDAIIATKSTNSNVVKGVQLD